MSDYSSTFATQRPALDLQFDKGSAQLDSRISFSRTDTPATYAAPSAVHFRSNDLHLSEENLHSYSNDLSQGVWVKGATTTPSTNNAAPDGTTTATALTENSATSAHNVYAYFPSTSGGNYAFTTFAKANGRTKFQLAAGATSTVALVTFDLTAVTSTVSAGSAVSHSITAIGTSGWYKCSVTITATGTGSTAFHQINLLDAGGADSYAGDGVSGLLLWGMQVSGTGQTSLSQTSGQIHREFARTLKSVTNSGDPRFEYNPITGNSEGLLIEQQFTQYSHYSEEFDNNGSWTKTAATVESNAGVAPDGTLSADLLVEAYETSGTNSHYMQQNTLSSVAVGETYTWTVFAKAAGRSAFAIYSSIGGANVMGYWDLTDGSVTTTSGTGSFSSTDFGNGWYRLEMTFTTVSTAAGSNYFYTVSGGAAGYQGNGYGSVLLWGANLTKTNTSMSYVKAEASTATKAVDSCSVSTADFGYTGGPVSIVSETSGGSGYYPVGWEMKNSSGTERLDIYKNSASATASTNWHLYAKSNGTDTVNTAITSSASAGKIGVSFNTNDIAFTASGNAVQTDTTTSLLGGISELYIGHVSTQAINGHVKRLALYNVALSDTELKSLTS